MLEAGKAVGLLRALGVPIAGEVGDQRWMETWRPFDGLLLDDSVRHRDEGEDEGAEGAFAASTEDFARMVYEELVAPCKQAKEKLTRVLIDDCDLWLHLTMMEDLYLMRRGDILSNFVELLFNRVSGSFRYVHFRSDSDDADGRQSRLGRFPLPQ